VSEEKMYSSSEVASLLRGSLIGWGVAAILFCAIPASYVFVAIPQFQSLFKGFGADLPGITTFFIHQRYVLWILPAILLLLIGFALSRAPKQAIETHRIFVAVIAAVCCLSVVLQSAAVYAMYAPIFKLGAVV